MLTKKQMREIVAFDMKCRLGKNYDGRRYGSVTGEGVPRYTEDWTECYGVNPQDVRNGVKRKKPCRKTLRYNYIVPSRAKGGKRPDVTVVHVAVRLNGAYQPIVKDVVRWNIANGRGELRDMDYHGIAGWVAEWTPRDYAGKRSEGKGPFYGERVWDCWDVFDPWEYGRGWCFPWHETVNPEALKGTKYEWCQYASLEWHVGLVDWLMLYKREPKIELLAKAGLACLATPAGLKALKDRRVFDWAREHAGEIAKASRRAGGVRPREIQYAARHNMTLARAMTHFDLMQNVTNWRRYDGVLGLRLRLDYERLEKALWKWHVNVAEYVRYLGFARDAGYDLRNEGTLYPPVAGGRKAFMARLEAVEAEVAKFQRAQKQRERRRLKKLAEERIAEIEMFQRSLERTKALRGCGYTLVLAKTQKELLAYGKKMNNCVGNGIYGRGIAEGDTLILEVEGPDMSYCVEIQRRNWTVRQCYKRGNKEAPKEVWAIARKVAAACKAEWQRQKRRAA